MPNGICAYRVFCRVSGKLHGSPSLVRMAKSCRGGQHRQKSENVDTTLHIGYIHSATA